MSGAHREEDQESTYRWAKRASSTTESVRELGRDLAGIAEHADTSMPVEASLSSRITAAATVMQRIATRGEELATTVRAAMKDDFDRIENSRKQSRRVEAAADFTAMRRDQG